MARAPAAALDAAARGGAWSWGRYVVVYPAGNTDMAELCTRYRALLLDGATFASMTLEDLLEARALPRSTIAALRERYIADV